MDPIQAQIPAQTPWNPYNLVWDATVAAQTVPQQVQASVQPVQIPIPPVQPVAEVQIPVQQVPAALKEGLLEKVIKWIVKLIAKASGNADPITGQAPVPPVQPAAWATPAPQATGIFGQIGWALSGITSTAQGMVGWAVSEAQNVGGKVVAWVQNAAWPQEAAPQTPAQTPQVAPASTPAPVAVVPPQV